ncbi:MAG: helicase-related protein, partial [Pseudomonadota bacterium]
HNWSQVLVFTRTKFGANNVAEFLVKNGINAMALHGNKSQGARTQALAGFKSGEIRALVATDIAARGIDIDDLPHVVNYEVPNVPEDYIHRIGRTGRAGKEGQAVSLVCLDEEGFMQEIERFTKQQIPAQVVEGFGPEPGERAEPIAMGRQTLWGGAGKPPSRDVMAAAAKAARQEMVQRVRHNKATGGSGRGGEKQARAPQDGGARRGSSGGNGGGRGQPSRNPNGARQAPAQPRQATGDGYGASRSRGPAPARLHSDDDQPRLGAHAPVSPFVQRDPNPVRSSDGQPDPLRTSVDSMGGRGRRSGGGGGGGRGFGGGGGRSQGNGARNWGR